MKMGRSIKGALNYNEQKVKQKVARLIMGSHFGCAIEKLGFSQKTAVFESYNQLNPKSTVNTLHLSLNFSEQDTLTTEKLQAIAKDYMERIGFKNQPYLVYEHTDTSHPHIHIVTTTIQSTGRSIFLHNIAKRLSEPARKAIELDFKLIRAESRQHQKQTPFQGNRMAATIQEITSSYKFTSLEELNIILQREHIVADRGIPTSRMYQKGGLLYYKTDSKGSKTGIPIKSSSLYTKPTLSALEKKFEKNRVARLGAQKQVQEKLFAAVKYSSDTDHFLERLNQRQMSCVVSSKDSNEKIYFIDQRTKCIFEGEDIGLTIAILSKHFQQKGKTNKIQQKSTYYSSPSTTYQTNIRHPSFDLIKTLLSPEYNGPDISPELLKKRKRKK